MKRACHKRIIFRRIAEDYQFGSADALPVACQLRCFLDHVAHHFDSVHVDAGFCGTNIDGRADEVRFCQCSWNGFDQFPVAGRKTFLHESGIPADEVDADLLCRLVKGMSVLDRITAGYCCQHGDRCYGNSLVYDGNTVFLFDLFPCLNKVAGQTADLFIDLLAGLVDICIAAVQQRDPHGDGSYIQMFLLDHGNGFHDIFHV